MNTIYIKIIFISFICFYTTSLKGQYLNLFPRSESSITKNQDYDFRFNGLLAPGWGYNYDSLLADINYWSKNENVKIYSIGQTVQSRIIYQIRISSPGVDSLSKHRISIHARTHPNETQGLWVTKEIIKILLDNTNFSILLRNNFIFNIIPMYNPDGVELGYARENANKIDIESNWNSPNPEPEVNSLRKYFTSFMNSTNPIKIALNMHSSVSCTRYFVYHHENGTSASYAFDQQKFIQGVKNYFPSGIQPYNYYVSWTGGTATQYPESFFWLNYKERVLALTYEDMNCSSAGDYAKTANAILRGIADYSNLNYIKTSDREKQYEKYALEQNYPNPFNSITNIPVSISDNSFIVLKVYNSIGSEVGKIYEGYLNKGRYIFQWDAANKPSGIYFYSLISDRLVLNRRMNLLK